MKTFLYTILGVSVALFILQSFKTSKKDYLITASISHQGVDAGMKILNQVN